MKSESTRRVSGNAGFVVQRQAQRLEQNNQSAIEQGIAVTGLKMVRGYVTGIDGNNVFIRRITSLDPLTGGPGPADEVSYPVVGARVMPGIGELVFGIENIGNPIILGTIGAPTAAAMAGEERALDLLFDSPLPPLSLPEPRFLLDGVLVDEEGVVSEDLVGAGHVPEEAAGVFMQVRAEAQERAIEVEVDFVARLSSFSPRVTAMPGAPSNVNLPLCLPVGEDVPSRVKFRSLGGIARGLSAWATGYWI